MRDTKSHFRFDFMRGSYRLRSFYDFHVDLFVYYFGKNLQFILRDGGRTETLSLDFASQEDASHFYSKAATFGDVHPGELVDNVRI